MDQVPRRRRWLAIVPLALAAAALAIVVALRSRGGSSPGELRDEFKRVERDAITAFNTKLREERARTDRGEPADDAGFASMIEREILPPWRAMRAKIEATDPPGELTHLFEVWRVYMKDREEAWTEYAASLRTPGPHTALDSRYHALEIKVRDDLSQLGPELARLP
jgi:hypothetical protein